MTQISNSTETSNTLSTKVKLGSAFVLASYLTSQIIRFGSNLVLTRLLAPELFGIMSVATIILVGVHMFTDTGLFQNVIHNKKGDTEDFLNTAWIIQIGRGFLVGLACIGIAILLYYVNNNTSIDNDTVFSDIRLSLVVGSLSIIAIIEGFRSTKFLSLNRDLHMGKISIIELVAQSAGIAVTIIYAYLYASIWAFVFGWIIKSLVTVFLSHTYLHGIKNRLQFKKAIFWEIIDFGKWIMLTSIIGFLTLNADRLLLSGYISTTVLGIYTIAFFIASSSTQLLLKISDKILLPAFGEIARERVTELSYTYYRVRKVVDKLTFGICGIFLVSGEEIIRFLYDARYHDAGYMLEIMSLSIMGVSFVLSDKCFVVLGHVKKRTMLSIINMLTVYLLFPFAYGFFGLRGAVWLFSLSWLPRTILSFHFLNQLQILNLWREISMLPFLFLGILSGILIKGMLIYFILDW